MVQKRGRSSARSRIWLVAAVLFLIGMFSFLLPSDEEEHSSTSPRQPLVIACPNFLSPDLFRTLKAALPEHPLIIANELDATNFKDTRGWIVKFNLEGIERFRRMPEMQSVVSFFDSARSRQSNAFVINLLIVEQSQSSMKKNDAVGVHRDDTVAIRHRDLFFAHQVNVLYVSIPASMQGGQLEVWGGDEGVHEKHKAVIYGAENLMVEFKGSAFHRVQQFHSPSGDARMSLVLEQYRIPDEFYDRTVPFCLNKDCKKLENPF